LPAGYSLGSNVDGRIEVFAKGLQGGAGSAGELMMISQTIFGWSGWISLGGNLLSSSQLAVNYRCGPGSVQLRVFSVWNDDPLHCICRDFIYNRLWIIKRKKSCRNRRLL